MGYLVLTKERFDELWRLEEVPDMKAAEEIIRRDYAKEIDVKVAVAVEYTAAVVVKIKPPDLSKPPEEPPAPPAPENVEEVQREAKTRKAK